MVLVGSSEVPVRWWLCERPVEEDGQPGGRPRRRKGAGQGPARPQRLQKGVKPTRCATPPKQERRLHSKAHKGWNLEVSDTFGEWLCSKVFGPAPKGVTHPSTRAGQGPARPQRLQKGVKPTRCATPPKQERRLHSKAHKGIL